MDQKISIKIAGRVFNLTASSPEMEELYRRAADAINAPRHWISCRWWP